MNTAVIISLCGVAVTALSLIYTVYKDKVRRAGEDGRISEILIDIKSDIKELNDAQKRQDGLREAFIERLARVEESAKSAHKRITGLDSKLQGGSENGY